MAPNALLEDHVTDSAPWRLPNVILGDDQVLTKRLNRAAQALKKELTLGLECPAASKTEAKNL